MRDPPHRRAGRHEAVTPDEQTILPGTYGDLNPAAIQRQIQTLTAQILTVTTSKAPALIKPGLSCASADESTKPVGADKAQRWVFDACEHVVDSFPFPIVGIDSDNGSEFINDHLRS